MNTKINVQTFIQPGQPHKAFLYRLYQSGKNQNIWLLSGALFLVGDQKQQEIKNKETHVRSSHWKPACLSFKLQLLITLQDSAGCREVKSCLFLLKTLTRGKFILRIIAGSSQTSNQYNVSIVQAALGKCT